MQLAEIYDEIRTILSDAQQSVGAVHYRYPDAVLLRQVRSALRYLRVVGPAPLGTVDEEGEVTGEFTESEGLLLAYRASERLLDGDLTQKLYDGELGLYFKTGSDVIDTKSAAQLLGSKARECSKNFQVLLAVVNTAANPGNTSVFSGTSDQG